MSLEISLFVPFLNPTLMLSNVTLGRLLRQTVRSMTGYASVISSVDNVTTLSFGGVPLWPPVSYSSVSVAVTAASNVDDGLPPFTPSGSSQATASATMTRSMTGSATGTASLSPSRRGAGASATPSRTGITKSPTNTPTATASIILGPSTGSIIRLSIGPWVGANTSVGDAASSISYYLSTAQGTAFYFSGFVNAYNDLLGGPVLQAGTAATLVESQSMTVPVPSGTPSGTGTSHATWPPVALQPDGGSGGGGGASSSSVPNATVAILGTLATVMVVCGVVLVVVRCKHYEPLPKTTAVSAAAPAGDANAGRANRTPVLVTSLDDVYGGAAGNRDSNAMMENPMAKSMQRFRVPP